MTRVFDYERYQRARLAESNRILLLTDNSAVDEENEEVVHLDGDVNHAHLLPSTNVEADEKGGDTERALIVTAESAAVVVGSSRKQGLRKTIKQVEPFSPSTFIATTTGADDKQDKVSKKSSGGKGGSSKAKKRAVSEDTVDDGDLDMSSGFKVARNLGRNFSNVAVNSSKSPMEMIQLGTRLDKLMLRLHELERKGSIPAHPQQKESGRAMQREMDPLAAVNGSFGLVTNVMNSMKGLQNFFKGDTTTSKEERAHSSAILESSTSTNPYADEILNQNRMLMQIVMEQRSTRLTSTGGSDVSQGTRSLPHQPPVGHSAPENNGPPPDSGPPPQYGPPSQYGPPPQYGWYRY